MEKAIVQTLHGLVPTLSDPLPAELVNLSSSLLAQSYGRASNLKADEEIARSYACAHIACNRLKKSLSLPKIEPCPPCPPKIYDRLLTYLEQCLPSQSTQSSRKLETPKKPHGQRTPGKEHTKSTATPSRSATSRRFQSKQSQSRYATSDDLPSWVMPVIRRLCKRLDAPAAPPHVFAGVSSILTHPQDEAGSQDSNEEFNRTALIVAVSFFVTSRLSGVTTTPEDLAQKLRIALELMHELEHEGDEIEPTSETDVRSHMRKIASPKWMNMDWFRNIQVGSGLAATEESSKDIEEESSRSPARDGPALPSRKRPKTSTSGRAKDFLKPGLGTMLQPKIDYLSEESLAAYGEWKDDIMRRIEVMEKAAASQS